VPPKFRRAPEYRPAPGRSGYQLSRAIGVDRRCRQQPIECQTMCTRNVRCVIKPGLDDLARAIFSSGHASAVSVPGEPIKFIESQRCHAAIGRARHWQRHDRAAGVTGFHDGFLLARSSIRFVGLAPAAAFGGHEVDITD
jgi:hypothetical protein